MISSVDISAACARQRLSQSTCEDFERHMAALALGDTEKTELVNTAIAYHLEAGGQRFRAKLALSVSWSLGLQAQDSIS